MDRHFNPENARRYLRKNEGYAASLELRKVYSVLPDEKAAQHNFLRVVDESGEDYLYPTDFFVPIDLPQEVREALHLDESLTKE